MVKYCSKDGCGFANQYSITPPTKCAKCNTSFTAAFKVAVAEEEEDEIAVIRKIKKKPVAASAMKPRSSALQKILKARHADQDQEEPEEEVGEDEIEDVEDDDGMTALSADERAGQAGEL